MNKCVESVSHSKIKVEEHGRKAVFLNPKNEICQRGRIDCCLVTEGIRADFFVSCSTKSILVELKGSNIAHACDQLFAAVEHPNVKPLLKDKIGFVVICTRVPGATTSTQLAQQKARKRYGAQFKVFCNQRELSFDDF